MTKRKDLDLGNSDFKSIIKNNNYFIDKSLLIKEVVEAQKQVILLPRPRRFGKTLNLSMLKYYFDNNETKNLFENLNIWQTEDEIKEKRGKYPVIYLSFKDAKQNNWEKCYQQIIDEISDLYQSNAFLLKNNILLESEKKVFLDIISGNANEVKYQRSIKKLCEYLQKHYNQDVIILIDEYDTPIQAGYYKFDKHPTFYDNVISFMRNMMTAAYKDNKFLYKGVITGILRVSKESLFTGLNNVNVYTVLDDDFSDKFGFTENEVKQLLKDFEVTTEYEQIKKWYDGYKFGNSENIYNPWSILNYVVGYKSGFKTFWVNTSSDDLLKEQLKNRESNYTRKQLLKLINGETIEREIDENFVFPDLKTDKELLWTLFTFSGYLTIVNKRDVNNYTLKIPNYEIKFVFKNIILKWLSIDIKIHKSFLEETTKYLINNQIEKFEKGFKQIIGDTFSYFDIDGEPENVYQSYVLGLLAIIGDDYIIKSNRESGEGRYDIMLIPHDKTKHGIVIEIKQLKKSSRETKKSLILKINNKIKEALEQIEENEYYKELIDNKISNIIKLPIVFVGKEPFIFPIKQEEKKI